MTKDQADILIGGEEKESSRHFVVHTGEKGYEMFSKAFVRGVNISTFNMMHEMGKIDTQTWESVNKMLMSPEEKDVELGHDIVTFHVKIKENE